MSVRTLIRNLRRAAFETVGSARYSRPALNDLDAKLAIYLKKRNGFFIEAGANDGFTQSNTYYLERMLGWRGILVEAIPRLYAKACKCRKRSQVFNCALVPFDQEGTEVEMVYGNLMSLVVGAMGGADSDAAHIQIAKTHDPESGNLRIKVPGRTLTSILDECGVSEIDFMSLDVEGFEVPVLQGLDLERYQPEFLCVEARNRAAVDSVLSRHYSMIEQLSPMDLLYRAKA